MALLYLHPIKQGGEAPGHTLYTCSFHHGQGQVKGQQGQQSHAIISEP